jgi:hypothetical protein
MLDYLLGYCSVLHCYLVDWYVCDHSGNDDHCADLQEMMRCIIVPKETMDWTLNTHQCLLFSEYCIAAVSG